MLSHYSIVRPKPNTDKLPSIWSSLVKAALTSVGIFRAVERGKLVVYDVPNLK
jgi:hypothetical protein